MNQNDSLGLPAALEFKSWGYKHASRPDFAVSGLNLKIDAGQRVLLLGASGIGKSTILQGAAGILGAAWDETVDVVDHDATVEDADGGQTQGRILIDGHSVRQAQGQVGLVLQDPDAQAIFQRVGDNVAFGPENMDVPREQIWQRVRESMEAVGLSDIQLHRSTTHLSGGQMQRLALAGALAMRPGILLLDEPTANLDPSGLEQIAGAVQQVLDQQGSTMVLVEHRAQAWMDMIDRVVVLGCDQGKTDEHDRKTVVVADGSPDQVFIDSHIDFAELGIWVPERYVQRAKNHTGVGQNRCVSQLGESVEGAPILSTRDLAVGRDGASIATGIDLDFYSGRITALVGDNGAGKSTLAMTLAGLLEPVSGYVEASEVLVESGAEQARSSHPFEWNSRQLASRISYVFQNPEHQFVRGSVLEEVMVAPLRTGMDQKAAEERAQRLLERFKLSQYSSANPYTLSGGEKRRLTVASALAAAPRVLILDEPTFGQDRVTWNRMVQLIAGLQADGVCVIIVTHDRELVRALDARVVELIPQDSSGTWERQESAVVPDASEAYSNGSLKEAVQDSCEKETRISVQAMAERVEDPRPASHSAYIASINPAFRLIGSFVLALPLFSSLDWLSALTALFIEIVLLMFAGFTPWRIVRSAWPLFVGAPGSALAVLLYGKEGGVQLWHWGLITVSERSALLACATALRILAIGIPAIVVMLGIDATDLADSFSQVLHLPDRFVYGGLAGLRLFSVLRDDWASLTASRRSRGLGDDNKVKTFFPQAFALLVLSIRRSTTLAEAMEARGFGSSEPRSHARPSTVKHRDYVFLLICLVVPLVSLGVAWLRGTFAFFGN
ncbi:ABC transporter ATP-binding protein [Bombiscardovia coagulans]|uniref:ABC transporter ATP-binding protein n=2 Tax=Bombiscardovia coagulans TaxID=686666 RepID=A0A261ETA8_9BIFI|nr:ATP-binding cassette domain-containing protein [Bombiscardovia coagulans]OZG50083.1 ABC transporter ATP-binding protein [Bombiscardovia coagulans]